MGTLVSMCVRIEYWVPVNRDVPGVIMLRLSALVLSMGANGVVHPVRVNNTETGETIQIITTDAAGNPITTGETWNFSIRLWSDQTGKV